ncbi:hypothetical protein GOP47_0022355 [Adiantum capillus-veneris]|uniref:Uncharacterized protein n=1 Tax=Adiantum capillus-veneris TaxID=13818 RepID=A0A9D4U7L5_ADICA|nr:hypothetical protein GOP47_0022355 [Adiantum capillus-veneris]
MEFEDAKLSNLTSKAPPGQLQVEKLEQNDQDSFAAEALDWRGRPATHKHGGPKTAFYILASQGLWNVANFAILTSLVLYFVRVLQMSNASAANNVTNWFGTQFLVTLLGGFLGDAYWGRFRTCAVFQVVHVVGLIILALTTTVNGLKPPACNGPVSMCAKPSSLQVNVFFVGLYIIALGTGGYLPAFLAWGADQFDLEKQKTTFFGWIFVFQNIGTFLANTLFVWLQNKGEWALSYWLATGVGMLALAAFGLGVPTYRQFRPGGNSFVRVAQVMVASARKRRVEVPKDSSELHDLPEKQLLQQGSQKIPHTERFSFFDKAATSMPTDRENPWKLCNVTQVEELKCLCRMLPIWLCAIPFAAVFTQINTLFVEQAVMMDLTLGSIKIPPASMSVINVASIFCFTVLYPYIVVPVARLITGRPSGMTQLQRLGWGQVGVALAMGVAALVESKRLSLAKQGQQMSVFWLSPQHILLGGAQVFAVVGAMDFFYSEAPHAMRGLVSSLSLANLAIGSYLSTVLVSVTMSFSTKGGRSGWIPAHNLNIGHVDYFYWLLMCLTLLDVMAFICSCWWYRRR